MSTNPKVYFGISLSIIGLLLFGLIMFGYLIQENQISIVEQDRNIEQINGTLNNFVDRWDDRIKISNEVNNNTQRYQTKLAENLTAVVNGLQEAELQRGNITNDILGNLTSHRLITNQTNNVTSQIQNQIIDVQNQTTQLIQEFNTTNEVERSKAVDEIIRAIQNNTELIKQIITYDNITK